MFVKSQDGNEYRISDIVLQGKRVYGKTKEKSIKDTKEVFLGEYETIKRACEITSELTCLSWNNKDEQTYTMPEK